MWMGGIGLTLLFSLQGVKDLGTTNARYGGKSSKSVLEIFPTASDHQAVYGCRATNLMIPQSEHDAITLNVLCKFICCDFYQHTTLNPASWSFYSISSLDLGFIIPILATIKC